ncbi:MAG: membrane protein insertion efficiency factor YidD [Kiloniellaceae bacterium]
MKVVSLILQGLIRGYQLLVSPFLPPSCRYFPSCSDYARQAIAQHGPARGAWLALIRILRCHPWGGLGYDPVPEALPKSQADAIIELRNTSGLGLCPDCRHLDH